MTQAVQTIIQSFEQLTDSDKRVVATEIFRRSLQLDYPPLTDDELVSNADELFLELDKEEAKDG